MVIYHTMRNFQQKKGWRDVIESWPVIIFLGVILLGFAWGVLGFMGKMSATSENRQVATAKLAELESKKERLNTELAKLETEGGVEENIREKFGLAKEGEGLIVVVEDKNKVEVVVEEKGWFASLWDKWFK